MELLASRDVWERITVLAKASKNGQRAVAVAYLGAGAFEFLPMGGGDVLVVDCSPESAAAGVTNPAEVRRYLDAGVDVYRWLGLHAKVYVFGGTAVVGSANASNHSRHHLDEAVVVMTDKPEVKAARQFIESLRLAPVDDDWLDLCQQKWRAPKFTPRRQDTQDWHPIPEGTTWRLWSICTGERELPQYLDDAIGQHNRGVRAVHRGPYRLDTIVYDERQKFRDGDVVVERFTDSDGRAKAYPPARVERVWTVKRGRSVRTVVTLMCPRSVRPVADSTLQKAASRAGLNLRDTDQVVSHSAHVEALIGVWPTLSGWTR